MEKLPKGLMQELKLGLMNVALFLALSIVVSLTGFDLSLLEEAKQNGNSIWLAAR